MIVNKFDILGREISEKNPPYIIAEISANHNGSIERAKNSIFEAKLCGVDAVKIQTYTPDTMTIKSGKSDFMVQNGLWKGHSLYDLYAKAYTPFEWHEELFSYAREIGVTLFSSPFDESAVDLLEKLQTPAYKIASFEIVDIPLVQYIASKNKPILLSTGMASIEEIGSALKAIFNAGNKKIALFHCISSYPAPIQQANLRSIESLRKEFGVQVGLSDHTIGNVASIVATGLGASVIEKHFTISRAEGGVDSTFSVEPHEMTELVEQTRDAYFSRGSVDFMRAESEKDNLIFRRSIYFVKDVNEGDVFTKDNIRRIRPGYGLPPKYFEQLIGTKCRKSAKRGDRVLLEHTCL